MSRCRCDGNQGSSEVAFPVFATILVRDLGQRDGLLEEGQDALALRLR